MLLSVKSSVMTSQCCCLKTLRSLASALLGNASVLRGALTPGTCSHLLVYVNSRFDRAYLCCETWAVPQGFLRRSAAAFCDLAKGIAMTFAKVVVAFATILSVCTAQSLQTAAPAPVAAIPPAGACMSGQPAGQLTNAGTGTVSVTSDVATVGMLFPTMYHLPSTANRFR